MKPGILITGGSGLLALNWAVTVREVFDTYLTLHDRQVILDGVNCFRLDLDSPEFLERSLERLQPSLLVHAAGLTSVEFCEANPDLAKHVNVTLAKNVAKTCAKLDIPIVYISTDHLFQGHHAFVDENCLVAPVNMYGKTKAEAEVKVLDVNPDALVVRTNFYGWGTSYKLSFSDRVINALRSGKKISLFDDVFYTPLLIETLVNKTHDLVNNQASGIFNVVGDDRISKYDFGLKLAEEFNLDANLIVLGKLAEQTSLVRRPHDMSLSNRKASEFLGTVFGGIESQILRLKQLETVGLAQELQKL
jgi:dTDP-4-dehydrorhamnose reductase